MSQQETPTLKLLLIGNSSVGKSSLLLRFTDDTFLPQDEVSATIGKSLLGHLFVYPHNSNPRLFRHGRIAWGRYTFGIQLLFSLAQFQLNVLFHMGRCGF